MTEYISSLLLGLWYLNTESSVLHGEHNTCQKASYNLGPIVHVQHQIYFEVRNQIAMSTPHLFQTYIPESVPSTTFYLSPTIAFSIKRADNKNMLLQNEWTDVLRLWIWALKSAGAPNEQARSQSCLRVINLCGPGSYLTACVHFLPEWQERDATTTNNCFPAPKKPSAPTPHSKAISAEAV